MAAPIGGVGGKGGVEIVLRPPLSFIMRQSGAFRMRLLDFRKLWEAFGEIMGDIEREQFETEGHGEWPGLAASTIERKGHSEILVDTGKLRDSLVNPAAAMQISARSMSYGTDVDYAGYHQSGTPKMPQRQVISDPFRVEDRRRLETAMIGWIDEIAAETFGRI